MNDKSDFCEFPKPIFEVGDVIKHTKTGQKLIIIEINDCYYFCDNYYVLDFRNQYLYIKCDDVIILNPYDKILYKETEDDYWNIGLFGRIKKEGGFYKYQIVGGNANYIIPYNEYTKELIGTKNECKIKYKLNI